MKSISLPAMILVATLLTLTCDTAESGAPDRSKPINVGSEKQLFIDDLFFDTSEGIRLQLNPARKTGEHNVKRDQPWESATLNWFSVMEDRRGTRKPETGARAKYRMWYECYDIEGWPTANDTSFCYAESADGIEWSKPELDLFSYQGSTKNNILFRQIGPEGTHSRVHGAQVFKDPNAPKAERYKAVSQGIFADLGTPPHRVAGMYSADGLQWTRYPDPICDIFADSQYSGFWDDSLEEYVIYGRVSGRGRALGRATSDDFSFFEPLTLVLQTDDNDPADSDLYNSAALKYPYAANAYFMFLSRFEHGNQALDIRLAVSRDGITWTWPEQDKAFIPMGKPGEFDGGSLYMGQGLLRVGDALYQYYGGSRLKHNEGKLENLVKPGNSRTMSRVVTRLDGYVSVEAAKEGGSFVTPPLLFQGNILKLNVDARDGGYLRVGLLDEKGEAIPGKSIADCEPITGDHMDVLVRWKEGGDVTKRAAKPTRIRVELKNASLYAFRFTSGFAGKERDH
ncbi:MAG: hypothetical protein L3K26_01690 [Candidatus Hydrogenedentes bacterium]|nr:hypothetical protein [Candidatus Hydrogenedentota bacterium]